METITSTQNAYIKYLKELNKPKARRETGKMLVEGSVLINEAISSGLKPVAVLFTDEGLLVPGFEREIKITPNVLSAIADTVTPKGVIAEFEIPKNESNKGTKIIALAGVQDPGNVGTIIRTADAAGLSHIILSADTADHLSPKVMRSAMGSCFRLNITRADDLCACLAQYKARGFTVISTVLDGNDLYTAKLPQDNWIMVVGNEAKGIPDSIKELSNLKLKLPMRGKAESLNAAVAAGIVMYELTKTL